jgi:hypothetical protein
VAPAACPGRWSRAPRRSAPVGLASSGQRLTQARPGRRHRRTAAPQGAGRIRPWPRAPLRRTAPGAAVEVRQRQLRQHAPELLSIGPATVERPVQRTVSTPGFGRRQRVVCFVTDEPLVPSRASRFSSPAHGGSRRTRFGEVSLLMR